MKLVTIFAALTSVLAVAIASPVPAADVAVEARTKSSTTDVRYDASFLRAAEDDSEELFRRCSTAVRYDASFLRAEDDDSEELFRRACANSD